MAKTKFASKINPFTGESIGLKRVNADVISITSDPLPEKRVMTSKYDALFGSLKPGQCLRVPSKSTGSVAQGLRKWMAKQGMDSTGRIKVASVYANDKGFGRVWLLPIKVQK